VRFLSTTAVFFLALAACAPDSSEGVSDEATDLQPEDGIGECAGVFDRTECDATGCEARWAGTNAWSRVVGEDTIAAWTPVDPDAMFTCDPAITELDGCGVDDTTGQIVCWVWESENCARIAVPFCVLVGSVEAADRWPDWAECHADEYPGHPIVCGEESCWAARDPSSELHPRCE
jgi:hypothetical protein